MKNFTKINQNLNLLGCQTTVALKHQIWSNLIVSPRNHQLSAEFHVNYYYHGLPISGYNNNYNIFNSEEELSSKETHLLLWVLLSSWGCWEDFAK